MRKMQSLVTQVGLSSEPSSLHVKNFTAILVVLVVGWTTPSSARFSWFKVSAALVGPPLTMGDPALHTGTLVSLHEQKFVSCV